MKKIPCPDNQKNFPFFKKLCLLGAFFTPAPHLQAEILPPPQGLRPCCAFGHHLKSELFHLPVPFFEVENLITTETLGKHLYNDGSEWTSKRIFDLSLEKNGLIFTDLGGFIDTAHVRDTADYTFYLFQQIHSKLGSGETLDLGEELRLRRIYFPKRTTSLTKQQRQDLSLELASLLAFQLAQWHEIAQYFGYQSVWGISEEVSAFSPEDLYSNLLGAILAKNLLAKDPHLSALQFSQQLTLELKKSLIELKAQSKEKTQQTMQEKECDWWDNSKRVPNKWLVKKRDYQLSLTLSPNGVENGKTLNLSPILSNGEHYINWANLQLIATENEKNFRFLPKSLKNKKIFWAKDFIGIAKTAYQRDKQNQQRETQVENNQ